MHLINLCFSLSHNLFLAPRRILIQSERRTSHTGIAVAIGRLYIRYTDTLSVSRQHTNYNECAWDEPKCEAAMSVCVCVHIADRAECTVCTRRNVKLPAIQQAGVLSFVIINIFCSQDDLFQFLLSYFQLRFCFLFSIWSSFVTCAVIDTRTYRCADANAHTLSRTLA